VRGIVAAFVLGAVAAFVLGSILPTAGGQSRDPYLAWLREARASHAWWAAYYRRHPAEANRMVRLVECTGDAAFHDEWVRRYDALIRANTQRVGW
jgi:hypothetical protein